MTGTGAAWPLPRRQALRRVGEAHPGLDMDVDTTLGPPVYHASGRDAAGNEPTYTSGTVEGLRSQIEGPLVDFQSRTP